MGIKQRSINTITSYEKMKVIVENEALFEGVKASAVEDVRLSRQIVSDMEYGVGSRPTLPCCYDDEDFVNSGDIDRAVDIRHSSWDSLAEACNPASVTPHSVDTPPIEVDPTNEE